MPTPGVELDTRQFAGTRQLALHATLSGGRGDTAWQHTQLFRSDILMWSVEWMHKCARIINSTFRSSRDGEKNPKFIVKIFFKPE